MSRVWGCTPAQLRQVTVGEYAEMIDLLDAQLQAAADRAGA